MPRISVIIPTYNRAKLTVRAALTAAMQTLPPDEIIIADDGSTDGTPDYVDSLAQHPGVGACKIYCIRSAGNRGANVARNAGLAAATGEYVSFLDSDDVWHPEKLQEQVNYINERRPLEAGNPPVFCYTARFRVDGNYNLVVRQFAGSMRDRRLLLGSNSIGTLSSIMVNRWVARHVHGFDERLKACQDWDFYLRLQNYCQFVGVPLPLVMYYDGDIVRITRNPRTRFVAHLKIYKRHIQGKIPDDELEEYYRNLAEDSGAMGRTRWTTHFDRLSRPRRGFFEKMRPEFRTRPVGDLRKARLKKYEEIRLKMESDPVLHAENNKYMSDYRNLLKRISVVENDLFPPSSV